MPLLSDSQEGFAGGYDSHGARIAVPLDRFAAVQNMRLVAGGEMAKRVGLKSCAQVTATIRSAWAWQPTSLAGGSQIVLIDSGGALRYGTLDATTGLISLSASGTAIVDSTDLQAAHFRDATTEVLYIAAAGASLPSKWDGATLTANSIGTPVGVRSLWVYNQRLYGAKSDFTEQTVYYSALNNGDTLGTVASQGGSATIRTYGGGTIYGGFALGASNFIVHTNALSVFRGRTFDDIAITAGTEGVSPEVFPIYRNSYKVIDSRCYMATFTGLLIITENAVTTYEKATGLPDPIRETCATGYITGAYVAENARAGEIWFLLSDNSGAVTIHFYNKLLARFTGQAVFASSLDNNPRLLFTAFDSRVNTQLLLASRTGTGAIMGCDFATSSLNVFRDVAAGGSLANFTSSATCRRFFTEKPRNNKAWTTALVMMGAGSLGTAAVDSATGATVSYTTPNGGAVASTVALPAGEVSLVPLSGQGQCIDVTVTDSGSGSTGWSVASVEASAEDYGPVGH